MENNRYHELYCKCGHKKSWHSKKDKRCLYVDEIGIDKKDKPYIKKCNCKEFTKSGVRWNIKK
jgi:hypothetical protein